MDTETPPQRVELVAVEASPSPRVRLRRGDRESVADVYATADLLEGIAEATLDALVDLLPPSISLSLEQLHLVASGRPVIVVIVVVTISGVSLPHTGSALVGDEPEVAAAKAVLAAVNRRLEILPG